jgi:hypothetical protein
VSVIGIAVIPFVTCAVFLAGLLGRVAVMRWTGMRLTHDIAVQTPGAAVTSPSERVAATHPFVCESACLRRWIGSQTGTGYLELMLLPDTDTFRSIC